VPEVRKLGGRGGDIVGPRKKRSNGWGILGIWTGIRGESYAFEQWTTLRVNAKEFWKVGGIDHGGSDNRGGGKRCTWERLATFWKKGKKRDEKKGSVSMRFKEWQTMDCVRSIVSPFIEILKGGHGEQ